MSETVLIHSTEFRIFGPPGCGKTTTLGRLIAQACQDYGSEAVIAASFTRTAAREIVSRDLPINDDHIGTLHALCYRALGRPKLIGKAQLQAWNAEHPGMPFEQGGQADLDDLYGDPELHGRQDGDKALQDCNRLRGLRIDPDLWPMGLASFYDRWKAMKADTGLLDFTDLIEQCLLQHADIPFQARAMFLDEVQDFAPLELALARQWGSQAERLYLAGDDDQCLYEFKGATPDAFLSPALPVEQITILGQSYRVPRAVHAVATSWAESISQRMLKPYLPRDADGEVDQLSITYRWVDPLQDYLEEWLADGKTVAILASASFFLDETKRKLREWGIPFHNPYRLHRGDWNPLTARAGTISAAARVLAFRQFKDHGRWWTYGDLLAWLSVLEADGLLVHGAKSAIRRKAEDPLFAGQAVTAEDLETWMPDETAAEAALAGDLRWFQSRTLKTYERTIDYACDILDRRGQAALTERPQVILGTIHSVKGGEADIVVLFPDLSPSAFKEWVTPGTGEDTVRRCFYVGMTRAREGLYFAQPHGMSIGGYL